MAKQLGDKVEQDAETTREPDTDGDTVVGDVVALSGGDATPYDGDTHGAEVGVRADGRMSGDNIPVVNHGHVVAKASGVTAGDNVTGGNGTDGTTGQFVTATGTGRGVAKSDAGGTYEGADIPAGAAVIDLF